MELGVREWMILVGVLLVLAVLLDAYRRFRNEHSNPIRMSKMALGMGGGFDKDAPAVVNHELPAGGSRVVSRERISQFAADAQEVVQSADLADIVAEDGRIEPSFSESMEQSQHTLPNINTEPLHADDPLIDDYVDGLFLDEPEEFEMVAAVAEPSATIEEPSATIEEPSATIEEPSARIEEPSAPEPSPEPEQSSPVADNIFADLSEPAQIESQLAQQVIVVHVLSQADSGFDGTDLLHVLLACDLRYADMRIFHRYEQAEGEGAMQFSLANMVEPGTFDLEQIDTLATPGVSLFMNLPGPMDAMNAFDCMIETARCIAKNLNGELRDESHSVLTPQTLEHCRQIIQDFERQQLARQA